MKTFTECPWLIAESLMLLYFTQLYNSKQTQNHHSLKTYLSILQYTTSLKKYIAPYFILSLLASIFGVLNFALLSPLLKVLFNQVESGEAEKRVTQLPDFSLSKEFSLILSTTICTICWMYMVVWARYSLPVLSLWYQFSFQTYSVTFLKESLKLLNPKRLRV
jgi:hypothetical protein